MKIREFKRSELERDNLTDYLELSASELVEEINQYLGSIVPGDFTASVKLSHLLQLLINAMDPGEDLRGKGFIMMKEENNIELLMVAHQNLKQDPHSTRKIVDDSVKSVEGLAAYMVVHVSSGEQTDLRLISKNTEV